MARSERARVVEVYSDGDSLVRAEAERFVTLAGAATAARGRFSVALSGGSTPRPLYALLRPLLAAVHAKDLHAGVAINPGTPIASVVVAQEGVAR